MDEERRDAAARLAFGSRNQAAYVLRNHAYRLLPRLTTAVLLTITCAFCLFANPALGPSPVAASVTPNGRLQQPIGELTTKSSDNETAAAYCPQVEPLIPEDSPSHGDVLNYIRSRNFEQTAIAKFQASIRFKTVSTDEMATATFPLNSSVYNAFKNFTQFLSNSFPGVYGKMKPQPINVHGILMAWKGSEPRLKPTLLTAHYDVVPVDESTLAGWKGLDPFGGECKFDNVTNTTRIYGRGSTDMKHSLMSIMSALEALIEYGFEPRRTIMVAFGFDEELGGLKGHLQISKKVHKCVGDSGIAVLSDEGGGQSELFEKDMVVIGVAEKGYLDVQVDIRVLGGHASLPDQHTGIGIASAFVTSLENDPYNVYMSKGHPTLSLLGCGFWGEMNEALASLVKARLEDNAHWPDKNEDTLAMGFGGKPVRGNQVYWLMSTTQAVTMFNGGLKSNILPETVTIKINHRIHINETVDYVRNKLIRHASETANKFKLALFSFNETKQDPKYVPPTGYDRSISLIESRPTEAAPLTDSSLENHRHKTAYAIVAGTIKAIMGNHVIVSPNQNAANTDSRHYWDVTNNNIIRYIPGAQEADGKGVHTILESMSVEGHMKGIEYFATFVRNMDEADLYQDQLEEDFTCWDEYYN